jgi:hypothetical protein
MKASVAELYRLYLEQIPEGIAKDEGIAIGQAAAAAMLADRDGRRPLRRHVAVADRHAQRRMAPVENRQRERVRLGRQRRSVHAQGTDQFRTEGPYDMASPSTRRNSTK